MKIILAGVQRDIDPLRDYLKSETQVDLEGYSNYRAFATSGRVDALWVDVAALSMGFGIDLAPTLHLARVLATPERSKSKGFPPFLISCFAWTHAEGQDLKVGLPLFLGAAGEAIRAHNEQSLTPISTFGLWADDLGLNKAAPEVLVEAFAQGV